MKRYFALLFTIVILFARAVAPAAEANVESFSPEGTVKKVRQMTARFSEPMAAFGDPQLSDPFDISCTEKGKGRWADGRNWVYDFDKDLPAGIRCTFTTKKGLKTLSGQPVAERQFSFSTGGPSVTSITPEVNSDEVEEEQVFLLELDAVAERDSILANAYLVVSGLKSRVGIRIIEGEVRNQILKGMGCKESAANFLLVQGLQRLPNEADVRFVWGKEILSLNGGIPTEQDQSFAFKIRPVFKAEFSCYRENSNAACLPFEPMEIRFSVPVRWADVSQARLKSTVGDRVYKPFVNVDGNTVELDSKKDRDREKLISKILFKDPFPEKTEFKLFLPTSIRDETGRILNNADRFPLQVATSEYPPLAKFPARFGIIEWKEGAFLPVTLRNLESQVLTRQFDIPSGQLTNNARRSASSGQSYYKGIKGKIQRVESDRETQVIAWLEKVAVAHRKNSVLNEFKGAKTFLVPKTGGDKAFEVVGIPLNKPGFYVVEMESRILGKSLLDAQKPMYVPTSALVTNMAVHLKEGKESSLVWVTSLDKGQPVADAAITMRDCTGKVFWRGKSNLDGIAMIQGPLPKHIESCSRPDSKDDDLYSDSGYPWMDSGFFVFARKADDMTFVHSSWRDGIEPYQFNLPVDYDRRSQKASLIFHTVLDRPLFRAGEEVHMKHFARMQNMHGLALSDRKALPNWVTIRHYGTDQEYTCELKWDDANTGVSNWQIPRDAKLGTYKIILSSKKPNKDKKSNRREQAEEYEAGSFRVEEFRVPLMIGVIDPPKASLIGAAEADVNLLVKYLAGGGVSDGHVRFRSQVQPKYISFPDYDEFSFSGEEIKEGIIKRGEYEQGEDGASQVSESRLQSQVKTADITLDQGGAARTRITELPAVSVPHDIHSELEFRDPNGEVQTVSANIPLWSSAYLVGVKPGYWVASRDSVILHTIVTDVSGRPLPNIPVKVNLFKRSYYSHRKRLIGGFYSYEHAEEVERIETFCEGQTDSKGLLICENASPVTGQIILQAEAADPAGRRSFANRDIWIPEEGNWWFKVGDNDRIDLLPEKKRYEPGDTARLQVRMPFREATVLVTVEREGVIDAFIQKVSGKSPMIEVPIKSAYAPNVFVSALCVRGRVPGTNPTALIDLAKPAFKLGIAGIKVGWKAHELKVNVSTSKSVYQVREKMPVHVNVARAAGGAPPRGSEIAVAVIDEGLLELMPNRSWKLLEAMMAERPYAVETSTAQMQVVGKRHFGLKAVPHGGGGGKQKTREMLDTLVFWKARVPLNEKGEADFEVPLNDSLTSFRIAAVASGGADLFGTGETSIRTTQDVMLFSGLPPLVREGDRFRAGVTVKNSTDRDMALEVRGNAIGLDNKLPQLQIMLAAGEAKECGWDVSVSQGRKTLEWDIAVEEKHGTGRDRLKVKQNVEETVALRTLQVTIFQLDKAVALPVERPADAVPGKGGVEVTLRSKLAGSLTDVHDYMLNYPYACMEQKVSRSIALQDPVLWKKTMAELPAYLDGSGLVKYFAMDWLCGSDVLTAYILSIAHEAGYAIPEETMEKMAKGLEAFINGRTGGDAWLANRNLTIRKLAALEALARIGKAKPDMLSSMVIEPNLWPTSAIIDWMSILMRIKDIPDRDKFYFEADRILRSRLNFQGTTMLFSTEQSDYLWWLMRSGDENAVKLILTLMDVDRWREDMPRLVTGALHRQHRGRWHTTTANAWGVLAMKRFSEKFEAVPVMGKTLCALGGYSKTVNWKKMASGGNVLHPWQFEQNTLNLKHEGTGRPWATVRSLAAIPLKEPFSSGYKFRKSLIPVEQKVKGKWSRGDVVRIRLDLEAQTDMTWVVVNDPVPAGSTILGTGLGRDSQMLTSGEKAAGRAWPAFEERKYDSFRAYYEFVAKGTWSVEYTVRLNASGEFLLPETRVEALYAPELCAESPNQTLVVGE